MSIPTLLIEQDPKNDERFRITISEAIIGMALIKSQNVMVHHLESATRAMKRELACKAYLKLLTEPSVQWAMKHGGRKIARSTCFKPKGFRVTHYRAGISITFHERDKAMLFKMMFLNRPAEPLAFAA
jgi:hypothetical protein